MYSYLRSVSVNREYYRKALELLLLLQSTAAYFSAYWLGFLERYTPLILVLIFIIACSQAAENRSRSC